MEVGLRVSDIGTDSVDLPGSLLFLLPNYRKVASSNTSCLEAHAGFFQIVYEGVFWSLCTVNF